MPRVKPKLTDLEIKNAKPKPANYKLFDDGGLYLLVRPTGTKCWRYPYKFNGKHNIYTIGRYPDMGAAEARRLRDEVKTQLRSGICPNQKKQTESAAIALNKENTFEQIAREWHGKQVWTPKHSQNILMTLEKDVFPVIGSTPIKDVSPQDVLGILKTIEARGALDVANRVCQRCTAIFDYAIDKDLCDRNPASGRSRTIAKRKVTHRPSLKAEQLPEFFQRLNNYSGGRIVQLGLELLLLTFLRPGELVEGRWDEVNLDERKWTIPETRMKMKRKHVVPLSSQVVALFKELKELTGHTSYLFPSELNSEKTLSNATLRKALIIMGYEGEKKVVPHGMRSTASTILNESGRFRPDVIEKQLAHAHKNRVRSAYNHAEYMKEREEMMQWWADYLDEKRSS